MCKTVQLIFMQKNNKNESQIKNKFINLNVYYCTAVFLKFILIVFCYFFRVRARFACHPQYLPCTFVYF